ncbi:MAG: hypothetical protein IJR02_04555 [Bacteroidaceae bacterium]|nr:hypothetical protein [Bacteroidaceae bacterium]
MSRFSLHSRWMALSVTLLVGVGVFLFWFLGYPHALSYQEQYQLFLWTGDYFWEDVRQVGGLADWLGEFFVQFYYVEWLGAAVLALLFVAFLGLTTKVMGNIWYALLPTALLHVHMGDESVLLSYVVALLLALSVSLAMRKTHYLFDLLVVPVLYLLIGPVAWLYVFLRLIQQKKWRAVGFLLYLLAIQLVVSNTLLHQWPFQSTMYGTNYYRIPLKVPPAQVLIPVFILLFAAWGNPFSRLGVEKWRVATLFTIAGMALFFGFDKEKYELIRQDYLIRHERWQEVVSRAEKYQVPVSFSSECVNLSLAMTGQLAQRQFSFYQSGEDALVMPMVRDLTSNLPTMEAFYRLGMVNESMRYAFDLQESILNGKKSGRLTKRIAECCIINGKYAVAKKYLDLLQQSLFYREWAKDAKTYLGNEAWIDAHPQWGKLRKLRYKDDFLYNYGEMDKMFGNLFINNPDNKLALEYFLAQLLLKGDVAAFQQYLGWAQQYGGYPSMPHTYEDAMRCIQAHGQLSGSPYAAYAQRMTAPVLSVATESQQTQPPSAH